MRKAKATYYAPEGENPVVTMGPPNDPNAIRFIDGQEVELNDRDNGALIENLKSNPFFEVEVGEEEKEEAKSKRGRPKKDDRTPEQKQKDYAIASGERIPAEPDASKGESLADTTGAEERGAGYQGGPVPGGKATGVPGTPPLPEGKDGETLDNAGKPTVSFMDSDGRSVQSKDRLEKPLP